MCDAFSLDCSEQAAPCTNASASCPASDSFGSPAHWPSPDTAESLCNDALDNDLDGLINDGCPVVGAMGETGAQCANAINDDSGDDSVINDGCPVPALPITQNICQPGVRTCPLKANCQAGNSFGICSGEVKACGPDAAPGSGCDACNGLDDDCDNAIDEDFLDADCSTNCGIGRTVCQNGNIVCNSTAATGDATCDNVDDDCDLKFDEDWLCDDLVAPFCAGGDCLADPSGCDPCGQGVVCMGVQECQNGVEICDGGPINTEVCNCLDDDCDTIIDEDPDPNTAICPGGGTCVPGTCQCAFGCAQGEFPCPLGKKCEMTQLGDFCVTDPCFNVTCNPVNGNQQSCVPKPNFPNEAQCVDTCSLINDTNITTFPPCTPGSVCFGPAGECRPDTCLTFPERCTGNENCIDGQCISNPCQGVTCDGSSYCLGGECIASCSDVTCPTGQRCRMGACETDPCGNPCPFGQACNDTTGQCIEDPCKFRNCPDGQWCNPNAGLCENDPCQVNNIDCPNADDVCRGGTCVDPDDDIMVDAAGGAHVTVGGGGGCNTSGDGGGLLLVLGALGLLVSRRRRTVGGAL